MSCWRTGARLTSPRFRSVLDRFVPYKPGRVRISPGRPVVQAGVQRVPVRAAALGAAGDHDGSRGRQPVPGQRRAGADRGDRAPVRGPQAHIAVGCGSVGVTQQLLGAVAEPGGQVLYAWRSFEAYPRLADLSGAESVRVPLRDETHDLDAMADAITERTRVIFVCNPNNPTGTVVRRAELEEFLDAVPPDCLVVLDEAYPEYVRDPDVPDGLSLYRGPAEPRGAAHVLQGVRAGRAAGGVHGGGRAGRGGRAQDDAAVHGELRRPGGGDRVAGRRARAAGPGRRGRRRAGAGPRRAARRRLDGAAHRGQLRLAAAGRGHRGLRGQCAAAGIRIRPFADEGARVSIGDPRRTRRSWPPPAPTPVATRPRANARPKPRDSCLTMAAPAPLPKRPRQ